MLGFEVEHQGNHYLNPVLRVPRGATVRADFWNALDETSIIHWHGLKVDANNDGHPHYAIAAERPTRTTTPSPTVPPPVGTTRTRMAARPPRYTRACRAVSVEDEDDFALRKSLDLATGVTDVPLVIQDKRLDEHGVPLYAPTEAEWMHGYLATRFCSIDAAPPPRRDGPHLPLSPAQRFDGADLPAAFTEGSRALDFMVLGGTAACWRARNRARSVSLARRAPRRRARPARRRPRRDGDAGEPGVRSHAL